MARRSFDPVKAAGSMALELGRTHPWTKLRLERQEPVPLWRCGFGRPGAVLLEPPMQLCICDVVERAEILGTWALVQFCLSVD